MSIGIILFFGTFILTPIVVYFVLRHFNTPERKWTKLFIPGVLFAFSLNNLQIYCSAPARQSQAWMAFGFALVALILAAFDIKLRHPQTLRIPGWIANAGAVITFILTMLASIPGC